MNKKTLTNSGLISSPDVFPEELALWVWASLGGGVWENRQQTSFGLVRETESQAHLAYHSSCWQWSRLLFEDYSTIEAERTLFAGSLGRGGTMGRGSTQCYPSAPYTYDENLSQL